MTETVLRRNRREKSKHNRRAGLINYTKRIPHFSTKNVIVRNWQFRPGLKTLEESEEAPEIDTDMQCAETSGVERAEIRSVQGAIEINVESESSVISGRKRNDLDSENVSGREE